jgi:hypothetical protein
MPVEDCIRCGEAPRADEEGYCGHCHWAVKVEIQEGFHQLCTYLAGWARFDDWRAGPRGDVVTRE